MIKTFYLFVSSEETLVMWFYSDIVRGLLSEDNPILSRLINSVDVEQIGRLKFKESKTKDNFELFLEEIKEDFKNINLKLYYSRKLKGDIYEI